MSEITSIVCPHVFSNERAVRLLIHHSDGTWQAACGERDHASDCSDFRAVGLNHLFDRQFDLRELAAMRPSHLAEWSAGSWNIAPFDEENDLFPAHANEPPRTPK